MKEIPRTGGLDSTFALASDGYEFISRRCERLGSDVFHTRLTLRPFICMRGVEAAQVFYDPQHFERKDVAPVRVKQTLFGTDGVQSLDGEEHRSRKMMFMSMMRPERIEALAQLTAEKWRECAGHWGGMNEVVLLDEVPPLLCKAVCEWSAIPATWAEVGHRARDMVAMINGPVAFGPKHWAARKARNRLEKWAGGLVDEVRDGSREAQPDSALAIVATHRDAGDRQLDQKLAAVELLNVLRPAVAVSLYVVYEALALHQHPRSRERIASDPGFIEPFVQEVRRYYPFFPFVAARVCKSFEWQGYRLPEGHKVLLDLYGTNRDRRTWPDPQDFRPERFLEWDDNAYDFIPQGGGDHYRDHRCPGEWITIALMKVAADFLVRGLRYDVPEQDLRVSLRQMPAHPKDGFVISRVASARADA